MEKKILVIGGTGMLGHVVLQYLNETTNFKVFNSVYRTKFNEESIICDVHDIDKLKLMFEEVKPEIVINCVGALVQESKNNPKNAIYLNAMFPYVLRDLCDENSAKLIHISTDCVFSGNKGNYSECDFKDADDIYGRSKALGEIYDEPHTTLRTSIIGPELKQNGTGLFHWFMSQAGEINGYENAYWGGVTTLELAKSIRKVIEENLTGLYQVTNGYKISKYDLLHLFKNTFTSKVTMIQSYSEYFADKSLQKSKRYDFEVSSYESMIYEQFVWINKHSKLYPFYK